MDKSRRSRTSYLPASSGRPLANALLLLEVLGLLLLGPGLAAAQQPSSLPPQSLEVAFPHLSFERMTGLVHANDGTGRLWVLTQAGQVMVFPNDRDTTTSSVFLDIRDKASRQGNEEGLLGLAFDPGYADNGHFYVYYSAAGPRRSVVSRFSASSTDPNQADPSSELVLLEVDQPFSNHNGGAILFGPDGYLYIALGDGGSAGDPLGHGQNTATLLGSILRIDVANATAQEPYRIPPGNPFAGVTGAREEIWAYGLRNPWRIAFDPATGELWAADVGQNQYEEINVIEKGLNYGWNVMEGGHCFIEPAHDCNQTGLEFPVFEYSHQEGCSITGGQVYKGDRISELRDAYVYADFCSGRIWGLRYNGAIVTEQALLVDSSARISAIETDQSGNLLFLAFDGRIYQFTASEPEPTIAAIATAAGPSPTPTATSLPPATGDAGPSSPAILLIVLAGVLVMAGGGVLIVLRIRRSSRVSP